MNRRTARTPQTTTMLLNQPAEYLSGYIINNLEQHFHTPPLFLLLKFHEKNGRNFATFVHR